MYKSIKNTQEETIINTDNKIMNVIIGHEAYEDLVEKVGLSGDKGNPNYVIQILNTNNPYLFYPSLKYAGFWYLEKTEQKIKLSIRRDKYNHNMYFAVRLLDYLPCKARQTRYQDAKEVNVNFFWYKDNLNL